MKPVSGIYRITCIVPGLLFSTKFYYYGQSVSVYHRKYQHFRGLQEGNHNNRYLQQFYSEAISARKNIKNVIRWKLVKRCPKWQLESWERYYIQYKRSEFNIIRHKMRFFDYLVVFSWQIVFSFLSIVLLVWRFL